MWTCEPLCNSGCGEYYIHTGQGTGHTSWWSLHDTPVASTIRVGTHGEPRSTISRQLRLAPRRTGSKWASPEVTQSVWFWWIWWTILPFRSKSQTGHWVSVNPFHSTLLGCISILSAVDMECGRQGLGTRRVYQTGLGSFRRLKYSWHPTVRSGMWPYRISIGRVRSPKQSGRITLMHMVSMVAGQEVWAEPPDKHVMADGRMFIGWHSWQYILVHLYHLVGGSDRANLNCIPEQINKVTSPQSQPQQVDKLLNI